MPVAPVPNIVGELAQCEIAPDRSQRYRGKRGCHQLSRTWRLVHRPRYRQSCHSCRASGGGEAAVAPMLSVPVFVAALGLTRLLAGALERIGFASLRPLLLLQLLLLAGFFVLCVSAGPRIDPDATNAIIAGMLGVSAMAVQNALVQISLKGAPSTAVMTTNITRFMMDVGDVMLGRKPADVAKARDRAMRTWPAIFGFAIGCGLGATCEMAIGLTSLFLPAGLALLAVTMGMTVNIKGGRGS